MRITFKNIAEENTLASQELLEDFYTVGWKLAQTSSKIIDKCLNMYEIANDVKKTHLLMMLHNCISDLCCCLDSIERGHDRTVLNNLRMVFEDFCCVLHMQNEDKIYKNFISNRHTATDSIGPAKKLRPNDKSFKWLYGELSKISHHKNVELLARQMVSREGQLSHLKPISPNKLSIQVFPILIIINFLRSIGKEAEKICIHLLPTPYFWIGPSKQNLKTEEDALILKLIPKADSIFKGKKFIKHLQLSPLIKILKRKKNSAFFPQMI